MPTNETLAEKCIARTNDYHRLGTDADGDVHYLSPQLGPQGQAIAWVVRDGTVYHRTVAGAKAHIEHIAEGCGWESHRYDDRPVSVWLTDSVAEAEA